MKIITIDFETYYDKDFTLRKMSNVKYLRDKRFFPRGAAFKVGGGASYWVADADINREMQAIDSKFGLDNIAMLSHNTVFDAAIMQWYYGVRVGLYLDTMSMARAVYGSAIKAHNLNDLSIYLGTGGKIHSNALAETSGKINLTPQENQNLITYALMDADLTYANFSIMRKLFPKQEYKVIDWVIRAAVESKLHIDVDSAYALSADEMARKDAAFLALNVSRVTLGSSDKFAAVLAPLLAEYDLDVPMKKNKDGKDIYAFAKSDSEFADLIDHDDERISALVTARLEVKGSIVETRAEAMASNAEMLGGVWPVGLNYSGAMQTHRFSGNGFAASAPQNLKRDGPLRDVIVAPPGYTIVSSDSSQIELRIAAAISGEVELLQSLAEGRDFYSAFASKIYGYPVNKKEHPEQRQVGKVAVLSCGYGASGLTFTKMLYTQAKMRVDEDFGKFVVKTYRTELPRYKKAWDAFGEVLAAWSSNCVPFDTSNLHLPKGVILNVNEIVLPSKLKLKYPNTTFIRNKKFRFGSAYCFDSMARMKSFDIGDGVRRESTYGAKMFENVCQALAREVMVYKMLQLIPKWDCYLQVHDELVFVVPDEQVPAAAMDIAQCMRDPVPWWPELPLDAETGFGQSYGKIKKHPIDKLETMFK